jgi:hypothetical protein
MKNEKVCLLGVKKVTKKYNQKREVDATNKYRLMSVARFDN